MDMRFEFPVVEGMQGGRKFYTACVPFNALARLLAIDTGNVLDRSQRAVDPKRAKAISNYICDNSGSFVLSALTGVVEDPSLEFKPASKGSAVGMLSLSMDASIKLFDGQHRATGILDAITIKKEQLKNQQVTIQLFINMTLQDRQQAFSDINSNAKAVSTSLNLAYNKRNQQAQQFNELIDMVDSWHGAIDYENNIVKQGSTMLFSFRHVVDANQLLLGLKKGEQPDELQLVKASNWWNNVAEFAGWTLDAEERAQNRSSLITLNAVGLMVLARIGAAVLASTTSANAVAAALSKIDWSRSGDFWQGNVVGADGNLVTKASAQAEAANNIVQCMALKPAEPPKVEVKGMHAGHAEDFYTLVGMPEELTIKPFSKASFKGWRCGSPQLFIYGKSDNNTAFITFKKVRDGSPLSYPVLHAFYVKRLSDPTIEIGEFKTWAEAEQAVAESLAAKVAA